MVLASTLYFILSPRTKNSSHLRTTTIPQANSTPPYTVSQEQTLSVCLDFRLAPIPRWSTPPMNLEAFSTTMKTITGVNLWESASDNLFFRVHSRVLIHPKQVGFKKPSPLEAIGAVLRPRTVQVFTSAFHPLNRTRRYLQQGRVIQRENLHVLLHARVSRVIPSASNSSSSGYSFNSVEFSQNLGGTSRWNFENFSLNFLY